MEATALTKIDELLKNLTDDEIYELQHKLPKDRRFSEYSFLHDLNANEKGKLVAKLLSRSVNSIGNDKAFTESFLSEFRCDHRTIKQTTLKFVFNVIADCAKAADDGNYDGRNEATFKACQQVRDLWPGGVPYAPLV